MKTEIIEWLRDKTIALCDGQSFIGDWEGLFLECMNDNHISIKIKTDLYRTPVDLSIYDVIAFATTGAYYEKVKKLMDFDTSNLKAVIVLSGEAYRVVAKKANELQIPVIGFDFFIFKERYEWAQDEQENIFFEAEKKWGWR